MVLIHNGPPKHAVSQILETEFHEFELRPKLPNLMDINAFVQILVYTFCSAPTTSFISRLLVCYAFDDDRYCWRAIIIGRRCDRAKASAACRETVSVRIVLPIDMKNLEATAHQHAPS